MHRFRNYVEPDHLNLGRPTIASVQLYINELGYLIFMWAGMDDNLYKEKYHIDTNRRVGFSITPERN